MNFGGGGSAGGSGGDETGEGASGSGGLKRKWDDFEATMKAMKDALVKDNEEKSAKIRKLMEDNVRLKQNNVRLEETVLRLENLPFQEPGPIRPLVARPDPFAAIPPEVQEKINGNVTSSSDLEMLYLAFPQLEPLVKERNKTIFLFENVLPLVWKHLDGKHIRKCRLVCEKWNRDVCALQANWNSRNLLPVASTYDGVTRKKRVPFGEPDWRFIRLFSFDTHTKIQRFMEKMSGHPGNPFFGRLLHLYLENETEEQAFWNSVWEMVRKFGEHIWNLIIDCRWNSQHKLNLFKVHETLIHLPNLKYLSVDCDCDRYRPRQTNMETQVSSSPLPPLPYLQCLKLALASETGMISAFSSYFCPHIRRLELHLDTFGDLKDECLRGLINLEQLEVRLKCREEITRLLILRSPNLKKLSLPFCYAFGAKLYLYSDKISITSGQVGSLMDKFSRLEYLDLTGCYVEANSALSQRMRFSQLKTLKIAVGVNDDDMKHNLDFLLWFPFLKHLIIREIYPTETKRLDLDQNSTLKIRNGLASSNVWTLMPSLELVELRNTTELGIDGKFTRAMYV